MLNTNLAVCAQVTLLTRMKLDDRADPGNLVVNDSGVYLPVSNAQELYAIVIAQ